MRKNIKQVRVWEKAHAQLVKLTALISEEKGIQVTYTDAVSIAIAEALDKRTLPQSVAEYAEMQNA